MIVLATFAGTVFQRIAGIGFALMLAPFMVVLLGPHGGVLFVNLLGAVAPALIIPRVRSRIDPVMVRRLVVPAALATAVGIGMDTDTVAAIAGALLGARWGAAAVPGEWRRICHGYPGLTADELVAYASDTDPSGSGSPT